MPPEIRRLVRRVKNDGDVNRTPQRYTKACTDRTPFERKCGNKRRVPRSSLQKPLLASRRGE
jgi:hypothetical protein